MTVKTLPKYELEIKTGVEDGVNFVKEIHQGQIFTIKIKIKKNNEYKGYIHSKTFPFLKKEMLFLYIQEKVSGSIVLFEKITEQSSVIEKSFKSYAIAKSV